MRNRFSMGSRAAAIVAMGLALGVIVLVYFRRAETNRIINLDEEIMACGFRGDPTVLPGSAEELVFRAGSLTLQVRGHVVFSGLIEGLECYRSAESHWGLPGGDFIQMALSDGPLAPTVARWERIYRQFGATPRALKSLETWTAKVLETERSGRSSRDIWLQGSFSVPETNIGIYAQSIPIESSPPLVYGSHVTVFWNEPREKP